MDLGTNYMGLNLRNPLVASASPLNADLGNIRALEDAGAGAVVLPSIFAEQIEAEERRLETLTMAGALSFPEAMSYFSASQHYNVGADHYLEVVRRARDAVAIPIIASLNGATEESWISYSKDLQQAGAQGLELNIYFVPGDIKATGRDVEARYLDILQAVKRVVSIPIAVKLSPYFSAPGHMAVELAQTGASALVLFNRFYQPDIDLTRMQVLNDLNLSTPAEIRLPLLWIAVLHGRTGASLAASTGVHTADEVVKYLLAGADVVMTTSALLKHGVGHMKMLLDGLKDWLASRNIEKVERIRGVLSQRRLHDPEAYERANYIKILQGYQSQSS
jgi:dihydroorotate dehydrogenase (fumarate)